MIEPTKTRKNRTKGTQETVVLNFRRDPEVESHLKRETMKKVDALSPATKAMLYSLSSALLLSKHSVAGYSFRVGLTRAELADKLDKVQLAPYDIKKLEKLVKSQLVTETRRALPIKKYYAEDGSLRWLGAGAEFVYGMDERQLRGWILMHNADAFKDMPLRNPERDADEARFKSVQAEHRKALDEQRLSRARRDEIEAMIKSQQKPGLFARLRDLIG